tara:strand:+ start:7335 stop:7748 length:414 start_codon:yes stop_codon:yes gene_type:complete
MTAIIIGITSGLLTILLIGILKHLDKKLVYGLILSGIGFLYVGFSWTVIQALTLNSIQAILFVLLAYYGIRKGVYILATGYFLHGGWDIAYNLFATPGLLPPNYDLFCSSLDLTVCAYILVFNKQFKIRLTNQELVS